MSLARFSAAVVLAFCGVGHAAPPITQSCNTTLSQGRVSITVETLGQLSDLLAIIKDPSRDPSLYARLWEPDSASGFPVDRFGAGILQYDPVQDTPEIAASLMADPVLRSHGLVYATGASGFACFGVLPPPPRMIVTEYYNRALDHYFLSSTTAENDAIAAGAAGPGWERTGEQFRTYAPDGCYGTSPVFRFYAAGARSHFFTADPQECGAVRNRDPGWKYEGDAFGAYHPVAGDCPTGSTPVFRLYNNRWMLNDSNHRYVTRIELYAQMQERGWVGEGVAFCLPRG